MSYIEQDRYIKLCDDLCGLLQDEKTIVSRFLGGDIYEEYCKLIDREIEEWMHLKTIFRA